MVRRFFLAFHKEILGVHEAAFLLGLASVGAKILALFRDRILAGTFGAGSTLDVYFAAFRIPDFLYAGSLLLTTSAVIVPLLLRREAQSSESGRSFIAGLSMVFGIATIAACAIAYGAMPALARWVAPGFSADALGQLVLLSRILLLSPLLLGFSTLVSNVIQAHRRFFIYALSPIFYNAGIIVGILWFYPAMGLPGLAWGVVLGAMLHFLIQVPSLARLGYIPRFSRLLSRRELAEVLKLSLPRSIGLGLNQGVFVVFTAMASAIGAGSIAIFQLAYNLYSIPLGVIGLSYSVAAFPSFARFLTLGKTDEFAASVTNTAKHILFWSLPFAVLFVVLRAHIVRVILGAGAFGWADTRLTAAAIALFSAAILTQGLVLLFVRAFYAAGRTGFPLVVNAITGAASVAGGWGLIQLLDSHAAFRVWVDSALRVSDVPQTAVLALVFALSAGSVANAFLLWLGFPLLLKIHFRLWFRSFFEQLAGAVMLGVVSYGVLQVTDQWFNLQAFWGILGHGALAAGAGGAVMIAILWRLKNEELFQIASALHHKFWKAPVVAQESSGPSQG